MTYEISTQDMKEMETITKLLAEVVTASTSVLEHYVELTEAMDIDDMSKEIALHRAIAKVNAYFTKD